MALKDALLPEFDHEMGTTRRLLERAPEAQFGWKPHDKSMALGHLATHLANLLTWTGYVLGGTGLDLETIPPDARPQPVTSTAELLAMFDKNAAAARSGIAAATDPELLAYWTLKRGDYEIFTMPKISVLRTLVMNHTIHHRGQFSVYLRMHNVPLPSIYGPTADEA